MKYRPFGSFASTGLGASPPKWVEGSELAVSRDEHIVECMPCLPSLVSAPNDAPVVLQLGCGCADRDVKPAQTRAGYRGVLRESVSPKEPGRTAVAERKRESIGPWRALG